MQLRETDVISSFCFVTERVLRQAGLVGPACSPVKQMARLARVSRLPDLTFYKSVVQARKEFKCKRLPGSSFSNEILAHPDDRNTVFLMVYTQSKMGGSFLKFQKSHTKILCELQLLLQLGCGKTDHSAPCRRTRVRGKGLQSASRGRHLPARGREAPHAFPSALLMAAGLIMQQQARQSPKLALFRFSPLLDRTAVYSCA